MVRSSAPTACYFFTSIPTIRSHQQVQLDWEAATRRTGRYSRRLSACCTLIETDGASTSPVASPTYTFNTMSPASKAPKKALSTTTQQPVLDSFACCEKLLVRFTWVVC